MNYPIPCSSSSSESSVHEEHHTRTGAIEDTSNRISIGMPLEREEERIAQEHDFFDIESLEVDEISVLGTTTTTSGTTTSPEKKSPLSFHQTSVKTAAPAATPEDIQKLIRIGHVDYFRDDPCPKEGVSSSSMAEDLAALSLVDRERIHDELHGIVQDNSEMEAPHILASKVKSLSTHLHEQRLSNSLLDLAFRQYPRRMDSRSYLRMYLRATEYNVEATVARISANLEHQERLFGRSKVGKHITLKDLDQEEDKIVLQSGHQQVLPQKDTSGRAVIFISMPHQPEPWSKYRQSILRVMWWLLMSVVDQDDAVQQRGRVGILSYLGDDRNSASSPLQKDDTTSIEIQRQSAVVARSLPSLARGMHILMDNESYQHHFNKWRQFWKKSRFCTRIHYGTLQQCKDTLATFGIPVNLIPLEQNDSDDGCLTLNCDANLVYLQELDRPRYTFLMDRFNSIMADFDTANAANLESATPGSARPSPRDILFGRGWRIQNHPGNILLNSLCQSVREEYDAMPNADKKEVTDMILFKIKEHDGRFLKANVTAPSLDNDACEKDDRAASVSPNSEDWEIVEDTEARTKVSNTFRGLRLMHRLKKERRDSLK